MLANSLSSVPGSCALDSHERVILRYHPEDPEPRTEGEGERSHGSFGCIAVFSWASGLCRTATIRKRAGVRAWR